MKTLAEWLLVLWASAFVVQSVWAFMQVRKEERQRADLDRRLSARVLERYPETRRVAGRWVTFNWADSEEQTGLVVREKCKLTDGKTVWVEERLFNEPPE